jgi:hypothetical protein
LGQRSAKRKTLPQGCLLNFNIDHKDNEVKEVFFSLSSLMGDNKVSKFSKQVIDCCPGVHRELGSSLLESA